jgi:hypothetical protein
MRHEVKRRGFLDTGAQVSDRACRRERVIAVPVACPRPAAQLYPDLRSTKGPAK